MVHGLPGLQAREVETLMDAAWPSVERHDTGEWVLRASEGVTQRANSVWPRNSAEAPGDALREATQWYRERRLPLIFQITDKPGNAELNAVLDRQGFTRQSETLIMARTSAAACVPSRAAARVQMSDQPDDDWLALWWRVDGRGGAAEWATTRAILTGCPSLYAMVRDDDGVPAAVGRLAMVEGTGGIYCMATSPSHRRRGYASEVLQALLSEGNARGLNNFWLLVTAANEAAQQLYTQAGFKESGRYLYRQQRPRRALTGC
ncbi:ribosomal protein S18 acetylase RimI-like enzyme [Pseudarthrobacter sp. W1I19]|uniref:GNAT family N-acetyltransferase n=1 Tax=Pseudarthrobacter sp. W1I19 TaxID=3042288 RepID=UPI0027807965|nr:GNAT family N-acetyltransferase [Pseudarthrobacter sp. W1I19]MDQ0923241.1 ribosomal protein S18 acetylase RimI-like enzyme [Pseudarthrobacter sp. W1I19]